MEHPHYDYCVVGGGPSGLTVAYKLLQKGQKVVLIERDPRIGGLCKSYQYGGHIFDIGPKRFHTEDPIVMDFIDHVVQEHVLRIDRSTKVYFTGKYFEWPLQSKDFWKLPIGMSWKCLLDLLQKRTFQNEDSFHEYISFQYGETLYQNFFAPYTQKFLRWEPEDLHSNWATTGINRTIIDKRVKANSLFDIIKAMTLPQKVETKFLYPRTGGFGNFFEVLLGLCQHYDNFHVMFNDTLTRIDKQGSSFQILTTQGKELSFDQLIWSGNLNDLCTLITANGVPQLHYLNTIFYHLICKQEGFGNHGAQWIYVSQGDSLISRISCMKEFAPYTCQDGYYNITCEVTDSQSQAQYFDDPDRYTQPIVDELVDIAFLKDRKFVERIEFNRIVDTYPIYHKRYLKDFAAVTQIVKNFSHNIHLLGRCGAFWYNNSDHSMRMAIELAQELTGDHEHRFNYRRYF